MPASPTQLTLFETRRDPPPPADRNRLRPAEALAPERARAPGERPGVERLADAAREALLQALIDPDDELELDGPLGEPFLPEPESPSREMPPREEVIARAEGLAFRLSRDLGMPVRLLVTDNRSTMVSFRRAAGGLRLRVHHMFLDAPEPVVQAIADYAGRGRRKAGPILDAYIRNQQPLIRQERHSRETELEPRGRWFDLRAMMEQVNDEHFQGGIQARIGWGRMPGKRRRKSIRLGVYDHQTREIRIHPALDRPDVPSYFVEFIIFHEMLHQLFPSGGAEGRRVHHPRAFRDREKAFPRYAEALAWERLNLRVLLRG